MSTARAASRPSTGGSSPASTAFITAFFEKTGVPLVLNTSYNEQEPLVRTPNDALATFFRTGIDALILGDRLVVRS